jgi:hypothetical protein
MSEPVAPVPEDRDWTYVIAEGCAECGFVPFDPVAAPRRIRAIVQRWREVLARSTAADRPAPAVWSPLEYACHVRDVCRTMGHRVELMVETDGARFANWDRAATAIEDRYWAQDPETVADELAVAAADAASVIEAVSGDTWQRRGIRSNGSEFTVATLAVYFLHDVEHHLYDVEGRVVR